MATDKTFSDKAAAWAFPIVTGIVGWFMVDKLNSIDRRLSKLEDAGSVLLKAVADIEHIDRRLQKVEGRVDGLLGSTYFIKPDEIQAPKRRK
jgi:hypothetical protein